MDSYSSSPVAKQLAKFNDLWLEACQTWPPTGFSVDTNSKLTWTITASMKNENWGTLPNVIAEIAKRWPWHNTYAVPQLHVTISGLGHPHYWSKREHELKSALLKVITDIESIPVSVRGINLLRNTIVVQIIDLEDKLRIMVEELGRLIKEVDTDSKFRPGIHTHVWWTSIARLYQPLSEDLLAFIESLRDKEFASNSIGSIQMIETTKGSDLSQTRTIVEYRLLR